MGEPGVSVVASPGALRDPLPPGVEPYQLELFPRERYDREGHYGVTPTTAQRAAVPPGMSFDHEPPLVRHYYEGPGDGRLPGYNLTEQERRDYGKSLESGKPATISEQKAQGGRESAYSKQMIRIWALPEPAEPK